MIIDSYQLMKQCLALPVLYYTDVVIILHITGRLMLLVVGLLYCFID